MFEETDKPLSIAIAHLFTTGRDTSRDVILHIACRRHQQGVNPRAKDWIVNPGRNVTRRVYRRTGISTKESSEKPSWEEIRCNVLSFLDGVDVLFIYDTRSEARWFRDVVYGGIAIPVIVDLLEVYKFFLPEGSPPYSDSAIINMGAQAPQGKGDRKIHEVLNGMYGMLDSILKAILSPESIHRKDGAIGVYFPVYSLLDWALTVEGAPLAYEAILRVASEATRLRWEADQIEGVFYDTPKKLEEDELLRFIENWKPPNLLKENRKPYNDDSMGGHLRKRYKDDKSTKLLLQVLDIALQPTKEDREITNRVEDALQEINKKLQTMRGNMFEILRRLFYVKDAKDISDHPSQYNRRHDELRSRCLGLAACLEEIKNQFVIVLNNDLSQILQGASYDEHLRLICEEGINRSFRQAGRLRRSLLDVIERFPEPDKFRSGQANSRSIEPFFKELGKLNREYFASTIPIQDEYLDSSFELLYSDERFNKRPEQRRYARFISEAIKLGGVYAAEAGTGTGKTLGYLIPACEHLRINEKRHVVVATSTINLMDQIVNKDWQTITSLRGSLYRDIQIVTLKGKRNYLCVTELKKIFIDLNADKKKDDEGGRVDAPYAAEDRLAWLYLFQILTRKNGQWDSPTEFNRKYPRIAKEYSVDAERACRPNLCRMGTDCIYPQAVRRAQYAHVVITNHHKMVKLDEEIKERASVCIIDEADQFPDNLRSALSESISKDEIRDFILRVSRTGTKKRRGFVQVLREELKKELDGGKLEQESAEDLFRSLKKIEEICPRIHDCVQRTTYRSENKDEKRWKDLTLHDQEMIETMLGDLKKDLGIVEEEFKKISESDRYRHTHGRVKYISAERDRITRYICEANALLSLVETLSAAIQDRQFIVSYEQHKYGWRLIKMPFEIGDTARGLVSSFETAILTSATLYVDESTDLLVLELFDDLDSAPRITAKTQISSPFSYEQQASGAVAQFIPAYRFKPPEPCEKWEREKWERERLSIETIALLSLALDGRTLVLFSNWQEMQRIHKRIQPVLDKYDIPVLLQDKAGSSEAIIEEFSGLEESVLLGTGRFWTGVDFPGPTLSQLIIMRTPNEPLDRPLVKERRDSWSDDKFWELWYAQNTRRTLCQGFGRLIRESDDKGLFIILDSRMASNKRMIAHQKAVPVKLNSEFNSALELAHWGIKKLELSPEIKGRGITLERVHQEIKRSVNWHPQHR